MPEADRAALDRRIQAQMISTVQAEERIVAERAEHQRLEAAGEQRARAIDIFQRNKETIGAMMVQFDTLMSEGVYNVLFIGGLGDIKAAAQPFYEARLLAQKAYALQRGGPLPYSDNDPAPAAGEFVSNAMNFYTQELMFVRLKNYRYLVTMQDVTRASVPFPDNQFIEYPEADWWRYISEKRIKRWGKAVDLFERDPRTRQILEKLDEPFSMSFAAETPLDDVLKYIKQATATPTFSGIPIYVDPIGLQEAERSLNSTVQIDLEGVPLKTTLRLILKQLGLAYTVKDGFLMITSEDSEDQQTEIRVYPVADLAIIPMSLMMGGGGMGGGGMGMMGGMGGMGGWRWHGRRHGRWHGRRHGRHGRRHDVDPAGRSPGPSRRRRHLRTKKKQLIEALEGPRAPTNYSNSRGQTGAMPAGPSSLGNRAGIRRADRQAEVGDARGRGRAAGAAGRGGGFRASARATADRDRRGCQGRGQSERPRRPLRRLDGLLPEARRGARPGARDGAAPRRQ